MYILKTKNNTLVKEVSRTISFTANPNEAVYYENIGDAFSAAILVNNFLGETIVSAVRI